MARRCGVTGKGVQSGNNVSHAHNKSRRRFLPNMQNVSFMSDALGRRVRMRISVNGIRTIEQNGGLDAFLLKRSARCLGPKTGALRKLIVAKMEQKTAQ